nr:serine/threonine-protein phosphatase [Deltaproteobacteria bacterium]
LKRKINEDCYYADERMGLFIVLDGIGGHQAGEVASNLGLCTIKAHVARRLDDGHHGVFFASNDGLSREANILLDSLMEANSVIFEAAQSQTHYHGMGTTAATLLVGESSLAIAHVGDSRIYLIRDNGIELLTEDHSLVMEQLKRGLISEDEARRSEMKNIITQALGADTSINPAVDELVPRENDIFLLCSDGLTDMLSDEEILELIWHHRTSLDKGCQAVIDKAKEHGGKDNITAILVTFTQNARVFGHCFDFLAQAARNTGFARTCRKIIDLWPKPNY